MKEKNNQKVKTSWQTKIKIATISLAIGLIAMISFVGIYTQEQNQMKNQVKNYNYGMEIKGARNITLAVKQGANTTIKDQDGKEITEELTDEQIAEKGYTKEETPYNAEEVLKTENYQKSKKIIEKRLKDLGVEEFIVNVNETTGKIEIQIPENSNTDSIVNSINQIGKFEVIDSETKESLMNNEDIKTCNVLYGSTNSGTRVYLNFEFNQQGKKKLENITNTYTNTTNEITGNTTENTAEGENNTTSGNTSTVKKVSLQIDGEELTTLTFDQAIKDGKLQLSLGSASTEASAVSNYAKQAQQIAVPVGSGNLPIKYSIEKNEFIQSDITQNVLILTAIVMAVILLIGIVFWIIRDKKAGVLAGISMIGFAAIYVLLIRYTNVLLSLEGIFGIAIVFILHYLFMNQYLKNKKKQEGKEMAKTYQEFFVRMIPIIIMAIVFCFVKWIPISSFGMILFWGILLLAIYPIIITNSLFSEETKE